MQNQSILNQTSFQNTKGQILYEFLIYNDRKKLIFYYDIANDKVYNHEETEAIQRDPKILNTNGISEALKPFSEAFSEKTVQNVKYFCTNKYKYSIFEVRSGIKLILLSNPEEYDFSEFLSSFYQNIYIQYVVRNILYEQGTIIESPMFVEQTINSFQNLVKMVSGSNNNTSFKK